MAIERLDSSKFPFLRAPGNYDADLASAHDELFCDPEEGKTQQSFADECDINTIVRRFGLTGELPDGVGIPQSGDFSGVTDFQSAMNVVRQAQEAFMELPAETRARFANDPGRMLGFLDDPSNREEAVKLGIVAKPVEKFRDVVDAVDELKAVLSAPKV